MKTRLLAGALVVLPVALVATMLAAPQAVSLPTIEVVAAGERIRVTPERLGATYDGSLHVDRAKLDGVVVELAARFRQESTGGFEMRPDGVVFHGAPAQELDIEATRELLVRALRGRAASLSLPMRQSTQDGYAIVAKLSDFRLHLYEGAELIKSYPIGVGRLGQHVHTGAYSVASKAKDPTWWNPGAVWSRNMPRYVPPGPNNPLGSRALRLDRDLLAIHGTPDPSSVGTNASRGCMRMYAEDVEELFEVVPTGTPVFIYE